MKQAMDSIDEQFAVYSGSTYSPAQLVYCSNQRLEHIQ